MSSILDFLAFRQIGFFKSKKYVDGKKAVLDLLEYEAAKPTNNEPCDLSGEPRATFLVDFSPNMLRAASTHGDHSVRITDVETGKCTHVLTGHPRTPWCLAFNPTSNDILASGCLSGEVRIWDLLGGGSEVLHNPSLGAVITSLAFHPSGQVLVFATINCVYFWDWSKPAPFAVTKTNHEFERIRWLRFDPYGKYLYTGIANNTTLHRERARNIASLGAHETESRQDRQSRVLHLMNRWRCNQLMQRFRHFQNQDQRAEYPENVRPRSPVHEENLNMARQYASHLSERMNASLLSDTRQRTRDRRARPASTRDRQLLQDQHSAEPSQLSEDDAAIEAERPPNPRGWGRYQPSFFTSTLASDNGSNNNNSNSSSSTSAFNGTPRHISLRLARSAMRRSTARMTPYSARVTARSQRHGRIPSFLDSSSSSSSSQASSPTSSSSDDFEPNNRSEELEPDEFEILPVEQTELGSVNVPANREREAREFDGMSASQMAQRLEQQLRQLRRELVHLTQRNLDINNAIMTLPRSSQSSSRSSTTASESTSTRRSAFRSAGSALSRSIFSRSGNTYTSTSSSSLPSTSSILSSALSTTSSPLSSFPLSRRSRASSNLAMFSRSSPSTSSSVSYLSYSSISGVTRGLSSNTSSSLSANLTSGLSQHSVAGFPSSSDRQSARTIPTTVTDSTSQTFGAMNLPERLDRSTDMTGLENEQRLGRDSRPDPNAQRPVDVNQFGELDLTGPNPAGVSGQNNDESTSARTQQPRSLHISISIHARSVQAQPSTASNSSTATSTAPLPLGILRSALTASSTSSGLPPVSTLGSVPSNATNRALYASSNNLSTVSMTGSTGSIYSRQSAFNDRMVFRSISNLRNSLCNIMSAHSLRSQLVNYTGERVPLNLNTVLPQPGNSSSETGTQDASLDLSNMASPADTSTRNEVGTSLPGSSSEGRQDNMALRRSIANVQRRISDVLRSIRNNHTRSVTSNLGAEAMEQLREVEDRFLSQTSQVLSQTTAYWTEFLGRSVMELNQRISELERRLESNHYLLSSRNPFSPLRRGRPQDALMSSLFRNQATPADSNEGRPTGSDGAEGSTVRPDNAPPPPPPPLPPSSVAEGESAGDQESNVRRTARGQIQRNQMLLDFLVWRSSRDSQSQRTLSFGQSVSSGMSSSSMPSMSVQAPILSSTLSASTSAASSSSSSVPISRSFNPSRDEDSEEELVEDVDDEEEDMMQEREEAGNRHGRGDNEGEGDRDSSWLGMQYVHLHPDYSTSILDETINRPNETMQYIMNRTIAGVLDREDQAVAHNIIPQTYRIQRWKITEDIVPNISRVSANIVVEECKLHNDASCDISKDGTVLATFVPTHRGFPDDNILAVFSLRNETFAQCLYTKSFGPNAISVSISPANHYVMVGLAARRYSLFSLTNKLVGQVFKLVKKKAGEKSMEHVKDLFHPRARGVQLHISVNVARWLPGIGEGLVYGTNRGDLHFCRPGPRRVPEPEPTDMWSHQSHRRGRRGQVRSSIATQTMTVSIRRSASTQTQRDDSEEAGPSK